MLTPSLAEQFSPITDHSPGNAPAAAGPTPPRAPGTEKAVSQTPYAERFPISSNQPDAIRCASHQSRSLYYVALGPLPRLHWRSSFLNANGALLMSSANPQSLAGRVCFCLLLFAIGLYLLASIHEIDRDLKQDSDWRTYFTKDAMHYYVVAQAFASGDFSMSYEKGWPYRQPLLPLLIAGVMSNQ
jgi:hypothetical protein